MGQKAVETLSFETALSELEAIVRGLQAGETTLEDSIAAYERGTKLKDHCATKLQDAQAKIEKIAVNANGRVSTSPLDESNQQRTTDNR
jgi:exodeoxyribonuclease VII small subunit